jgi:inosine-uridine nucleoside N-ribohydrolase
MSDSTRRLPVVLDCDPGHDDAVAIVVAARHTDLLGITTVAGNAPLERTTYNARVMRDLLGVDVEVHSGADRPIVAPPRHAGHVHGASGLDGADLPPPTRPLDGHDAVGFIVDTCRRTEGVWLVPVGPLTNVALALRAAPDLAGRLGGISLMGGGTFGNRSAVAEFNIWADPEAAAVVFDAGVPLVMTGLDATHSFLTTPATIARVRAIGSPLARVLADLFVFFAGTYTARYPHLTGAAVHDPLAVLAITHPDLLARVARHVTIETVGTETRGMTVIDRRGLAAEQGVEQAMEQAMEQAQVNCDVVEGVDADAAWDVVIDAIAAFTG